MAESRRIRIDVPALTRVEGEGSLKLSIEQGQITQLQLSIFEPPRYFEKFLEGRAYHEVPDIVARICGICPVAYQMTAVQALEQAFDFTPSDWVRRMRRLFYCGEWIQSHALHIHLLALPDYLGFDSAIAMAEQYPAQVQRGLELQALGNTIIKLFGGRSVHPVGARVGGFHHAPTDADIKRLNTQLEKARDSARALTNWCAQLPVPQDDDSFINVALKHESEYPLYEGTLAGSDGLSITAQEWEQYFEETHAPHSTALWSLYQGAPYLVGPLARLNLNRERLPAEIADNLNNTGIAFPSRNMFHSMLARAVEIELAIHEALELTAAYSVPERPFDDVIPRAGIGFGATEAPRGLLWHRYETDENGLIKHARIVPPTSQNQARIEQDLHNSLQAFGLEHPDDALRLHCEKVIRNYDPCISCATHFLQLELERQP
ncbi:hydrogenase/sulfur reductase, alpha subunit [Marinobacterium lacunae]|uniref:Hydrogenase/sulfur reductase, alpha subunit n=1 Tax=Marinobacterium lacunae TaxID=1232683 RepID=A0A081FWV9_9GAMM|nr:Ni/Fe hydrogenase subunit alpha [Marinobacterium lacunae]KEA63014.1 hydrogenase/sulfur reductase, alpha subunit [Marinobacterium lacunae]